MNYFTIHFFTPKNPNGYSAVSIEAVNAEAAEDAFEMLFGEIAGVTPYRTEPGVVAARAPEVETVA